MLNVLNVVSAALNDMSAAPRAERLVEVARDCCREAAALLRRRVAGQGQDEEPGPRVWRKSAYEQASDADVEAETLLRTALRAAVPGSGVVGEELPDEPGGERQGPAVTWYVDPLDGTHNFLRGLPLACVSVGVAVGGRLVGGCVHDVFRDESFTGGKGVPLRINGRPPEAGPGPAPGALPLVLTDIPLSGAGRGGPAEAAFFADLAARADPRRLYCTALSLAWVAAGRADLACNLGIHPWDVAAGAALVQAAGGRYTPVGGGPGAQDAPGFVAARAAAGEPLAGLDGPDGPDGLDGLERWAVARLTALHGRAGAAPASATARPTATGGSAR